MLIRTDNRPNPGDIFLRHFIPIVSSIADTHKGDEKMVRGKLRKLITKKLPAWTLLGAMLSAVMITGCTSSAGPEDGRDDGVPTVTQVAVERGGGDSGDEHGGRDEDGEPVGEGSEENGEHGPDGEVREEGEHGPGGEGNGESREAAMSSPIIPLGQSWSGALGGLAVSMQYDAATRTVRGTVQNTLSRKLCYVQAEPHLKSGTRTVGELGPEKLGHLDPGQEATSSLAVAGEPELAGISYDGYVVHMEVFDCAGPGPSAHTAGEGAEGDGEHGGSEGGQEGNGEQVSGAEDSHESDEADEKEGSGVNALAPDESLDEVRSGARLSLGYDAPSNSFKGTVENTTRDVLDRVRVEVHLSNGTELGPTAPTKIAPGDMLTISLPATEESFTRWTAHVEVGGGAEGNESVGEHGAGGESGGEHGGGGNSSGEHGRDENRRDGD